VVYLIELALTGDCRSELNDRSEDLTLLGLHVESLELLVPNFGLVSDFRRESVLIDGLVLSCDVLFAIGIGSPCVISELAEWRTRVLESELMDEQVPIDLSIVKSRESDLFGVLGLIVKLEGFESGPIVSPELNDFVLSGDFGILLNSGYGSVCIVAGSSSPKVTSLLVSGLVRETSGFTALYASCDSLDNLLSIVIGQIGKWPMMYFLE